MIAFDLEILRCVPSPDMACTADDRGKLVDAFGYEYCSGWDDYKGMGISVITTFDMRSRIPHIYLQDNFEEFLDYVNGQTLIGYNNETFDNRVLQAAAEDMPEDYHFTSLDLLSLIRTAAGEPSTHTQGITRGGRRLGGMAGLNGVPFLGRPEIVDAPRCWQRGERGIVIDYCMRDTMMLVGLLDKAVGQGWLLDSATGGPVDLAIPGLSYPRALDYIAS